MILPLELVDQSVGKRIYVLTKADKELEATLVGVDLFVNMVLADVVEYDMTPLGLKQGAHYDQLLLNGNNVALISIGAKPTA